MTQMERNAYEKQPWDEISAPFPLPVVAAPLTVRNRVPIQVQRNSAGTWSIGGSTIHPEDPPRSRSCEEIRRPKEAMLQLGSSLIVTLEAEPSAPTKDVARMLGMLEQCGVDHVDFVVTRPGAPENPEISPPNENEKRRLEWLTRGATNTKQVHLSAAKPPPLSELVKECPLDPVLSTVATPGQPTAMRLLARQALMDCQCAIDPVVYTWAYRLKYVPTRYTNVISTPLPVVLAGGTWQESVEALAAR